MAVGYRGGVMVAVATAELVMLHGLRARFAVGLGARLGGSMRRTLEAWSLKNPEEDVKGFAGVITAAEFGEKQRQPVWRDWGVDIAVASHLPSGKQLRIGWFARARV